MKTPVLVALAAGIIVGLTGLGAFAAQQHMMLRKAHATFENYYAFRGCTQLLERTASYGTCRLASGQVIKLVQFRGRWYLDGDLPLCLGRACAPFCFRDVCL